MLEKLLKYTVLSPQSFLKASPTPENASFQPILSDDFLFFCMDTSLWGEHSNERAEAFLKRVSLLAEKLDSSSALVDEPLVVLPLDLSHLGQQEAHGTAQPGRRSTCGPGYPTNRVVGAPTLCDGRRRVA